MLIVVLGDGCEDDLVTRRDTHVFKWLLHVCQEAEEGVVDWLSWVAN
jgi:hypothetical protein